MKADIATLNANKTTSEWAAGYALFNNNGLTKLDYVQSGPFAEVPPCSITHNQNWKFVAPLLAGVLRFIFSNRTSRDSSGDAVRNLYKAMAYADNQQWRMSLPDLPVRPKHERRATQSTIN